MAQRKKLKCHAIKVPTQFMLFEFLASVSKLFLLLRFPLKILSSSRTCVGLWSTSEVHQEALKPWQAFKPSGSMESGHISNLLLSAFSCLHSKGAGPHRKICRIIEEITHVWPLSFLKLKANARGKRSWCMGNGTEIGKYTEEPSKSRCRIWNRKVPGIEYHCSFQVH